MEHAARRLVGQTEVLTVCQGFAPIALAEELPGRRVAWAAERVAHPWAFHGDGAWAWHVHLFAIRGAEGLVLVDSGLGAYPPYRPWAEHADPVEVFAAAGLDPAEVRHVIHTHLHADHAGGATVDGAPRFPHAVHHVHPADWEHFGALDDDATYAARRPLEHLADLGMLDLDPDEREVSPGIRVLNTPGHTPDHRSVLVADGDRTLLLTGDLLHLPIQAARPDWASSHDLDPALGCRSRERVIGLARDGAWTVAASHFAEPFGTVGRDGWLRG